MPNEKSVIVKSVSLERTAEFEEFVACQKNFSRSIRVLIQQAIFQHNGEIVDIWEEYEKAVRDSVFRNQMNPVVYTEEKSDREPSSPKVTIESTEAKHEFVKHISDESLEAREKSDNNNKIPEGY